MSDPAFYGNCLACGTRCYGQSYCDKCSEDKTYKCHDCDGDGFEKEYNNCYEHEMDEIRDEVMRLKRYCDLKDKRIFELEQVRDSLQRDYEEAIKIAKGE